jgi:glycosyltransferase involved in cell wall biosynthesis
MMKNCESKIAISIIVPTHNRVEMLLQSLNALAAQTFSTLQFEVIVIADGCTDHTYETVKAYAAPYKLDVFEQENCGAAAARNYGASHAVGTLLLFLDDDITASPQLVEAHVKAHQQVGNQVVIGYLPPVLKEQKGFFKAKLKEWWEHTYDTMRLKGHRFSYRNLLSGNFSLPAQLFNYVGGFDTTFQCQEDFELGIRLIQAGAQFSFEPEAMGYHNDGTDLKRWLYRKYSEGKAAVQFCQEYPQLIETLPVLNQFKNGFPPFYQNTLQFIYRWNSLAEGKARIYRYGLFILEWLHMPQLWEKLLGRLQTYWYLRGIMNSVGDPGTLVSILEDVSQTQLESPTVVNLDLVEGLGAAEKKLNELRPSSVNLYYGHHFIGHIVAKSGFERLRGVHLRSILEQEFPYPLLAIENDKFHYINN